MDIKKCLSRAIEDSLGLRGLGIELATNFDKKSFLVCDEAAKDNVRVSIKLDYLDSHTFLSVFAEMLNSDEIDISFAEGAKERSIEYLEKLSSGFKEE
jgi:hypothetical protein